jgi:hypothetical protein
MNILFVGSTASPFSANLSSELNKYRNINVDAILSSNNINIYEHKYENVFYYKFNDIWKIPKINGLLNTVQFIIKLLSIKKYDVIHLHSINPALLYLIPFFKYKSKKVVSTVWGSDFERSQNRIFFELILKNSDLVTCTSDDLNNRLRVAIKVPSLKILTLPFVLPIYYELDIMGEVSKHQVKKDFGFPLNKIILGCGTNLRKMQNHLQIIDEIAKVNDDFSSAIIVLIQMTYDCKDELYLAEITGKLDSLKIEYIILSKFLSDVEMAMVRKSTDILIQVQDYDQFSGAMLETLYAENIVVTGSWLPYSILDDEEVFYFKVDSVFEMSKIILECVNNYDNFVERTKNNREKLSMIMNNGKIIDDWAKTYANLFAV